jgi:hypothetical protein
LPSPAPTSALLPDDQADRNEDCDCLGWFVSPRRDAAAGDTIPPPCDLRGGETPLTASSLSSSASMSTTVVAFGRVPAAATGASIVAAACTALGLASVSVPATSTHSPSSASASTAEALVVIAPRSPAPVGPSSTPYTSLARPLRLLRLLRTTLFSDTSHQSRRRREYRVLYNVCKCAQALKK